MSVLEFRRHIKSFAENEEIELDDAFLKWYAKMRVPSQDYIASYTGNGDKEIDLILKGKNKIILIQAKFGKADLTDIRAFHDTITAWGKRKSFDIWLKQVRNSTSRGVYSSLYDEIEKSGLIPELVWEFVSLNDFKESWKKELEGNVKSRVELVSTQDLLYYYKLDKIGAKYTEKLKVELEGSEWKSPNKYDGMTTYICVMKLPSLLKALKEIEDSERIFARNVRLEIRPSYVNDAIGATYETETNRFFFGNNGVYIICTEARFGSGGVEITQPSVINGGQTLRTLMKESIKSEGALLARITEISKEKQADDETQKFIDDIIFRTNSNNKMDAWDLRSNDSRQVEIARALHQRKIFYERKQKEWREEKTRLGGIRLRIDSIQFAQMLAICDDSIGPATVKAIGRIPLFKKDKEGGYYDKIFYRACGDMDTTETKIRLFLLTKKSVNSANGIPKIYKSFKNASRNFVFGILWRLICDDVKHPIKFNSINVKKLKTTKLIAEMSSEMFSLYKKDLEKGIKQNDIFRKNIYWAKAISRFDSWREKAISAINSDTGG